MKYFIVFILVLFSYSIPAKDLGITYNLPLRYNFCSVGYTDTVRPPTYYTNNIKRRYLKQYNLPGTISDYELDHIMPLGLNGHPKDIRNLQMQTWPEARLKDVDENRLRKDVCVRHTKTLLQAQQELSDKWGK